MRHGVRARWLVKSARPITLPENDKAFGTFIQTLTRGAWHPPQPSQRHGLHPGESMDLLTGWDFNRTQDRDRAKVHLVECKPKLVIGSPACTMFSALQNLTPWDSRKQENIGQL